MVWRCTLFCDSNASHAEMFNWLWPDWCKAHENEKVTLIIVLMMELSVSQQVVLWSLAQHLVQTPVSKYKTRNSCCHLYEHGWLHTIQPKRVTIWALLESNIHPDRPDTHSANSPSPLTCLSGTWGSCLSTKKQFLPLHMYWFEDGCFWAGISLNFFKLSNNIFGWLHCHIVHKSIRCQLYDMRLCAAEGCQG